MNGFWNSKTDKEILRTIKVESLTFIGKFKKFPKFSMFDNIRNTDYSPVLNLKSNLDDRNFVKVQIINKTNFDLKPNTYYKITAKIIPQKIRAFHNSEFLLEFNENSTFELYSPNEKEFTEMVFKKYSEANTANSQDILKSVKTITYQINKRNETFIYELLQNADDYPLPIEKVTVNFYINDKYLLFTHSGSEFNFNNVYSLCAVNAEDKIDDLEKIGFKGIGFKSVFKANEFVYLKSGRYSFRFDKAFHHAEYPWQLMPIWTDNNDLELSLRNNSRFLNSNVAIALKPRSPDKILIEYSQTLELFTDERILLFLRNVEKVNVFLNDGRQIFCDRNKSKWWLKQFEVGVSQDITDYLNTQISEGNEEVPSKFANLKSCKISFAALIHNGQLILLSDAKLFNYLPLGINLNLPFLINSDFIPDGEREGLIGNKWNEFLLVESGKQFVQFIKATVNDQKRPKKFCFSIINLIPNFNLISETLKSNEKWSSYFNFFKEGFDAVVIGNEPVNFIPTQSGILETLSNTLIDETGVVDLLKEDFFTLTGITGKLIHDEVGEGVEKIKALIDEYKQGTAYSIDNLKTNLKTPVFQEWLMIPANNFKLIQHFSLKTELQSLLDTEKIILSESKQLCKSSSLLKSVPEELTFTTTESVNCELLSLLNENNISLALIEFEPVQFFKDNILGKQTNINAALTNEINLLNFWKFVFDNWSLFENETTIKDSLKHFEILCKPKTVSELSKKVISFTYLSAEFNLASEIESVVKDISDKELFISDKYIDKKREAEKWNKIFKQSGAITDLQKVIEVLVTKLQTIEITNHFEIAKQIFKFWKVPTNKLTEMQIGLIKSNLKIKCIDNNFRNTINCIISDYYNINQIISSWLPEIELINLVSQEYAPKTNQIAEWKIFLKLIGCIELTDKQNVFDAKLDFFIISQDNLKEKHFEILKSISGLSKAKRENGLNFDFENVLSKIKLQSNTNEWHLPNFIHLSSSFKPTLDLQNDDTINSSMLFINEKYLPTVIEKYFLTEIGVNDSFKFYMSEIKRDEIPITYRQKFDSINNYIVHNALQYGNQHRLLNHIDLNYKSLLGEYKYSEIFWKEVMKPNSKHLKFLFQNSTYKTAFNSVTFENFVVNYLKQNAVLPNQENDLKKPTELFSYLLSEFINNKNELLKFDLSDIHFNNDQSKSLEDILGVQKLLSQEHCIELLSRTENQISTEQITTIQILKILLGYIPNDNEKAKLFLLNKNLEWKPLNKLFISTEEQIQIEPTQHLHEVFYSIADNFGIQKLSKDNLFLKINPNTLTVTDEIEIFFRNKAKFIAFKIDHLNYEEVEERIIEKIISLKFYEVASIEKVFPEISPIYKIEIDFHFNKDENKVLYKGNWKTNTDIKDFLFQLIQNEKIERLWFENLINRWEDEKIIEKLNEEVETTPPEWNSTKQTEKDENNKTFLDEVYDFIESMKEVEDIYDEEKVEELKTILAAFKEQPDEKRKAFNLLAKLKLCKSIGLSYDSSWEFNKVVNGNEQYFIHSARGSFAYIHPNEIIQMRDEGFKMAIDFGTHDIRIYNSHSEIIELYQNYLMLYQGSPSEDEILSICEVNKNKSKFHFLIVDREKQTNDALAILKILNNDSYE